jgi:hypothetical protein
MAVSDIKMVTTIGLSVIKRGDIPVISLFGEGCYRYMWYGIED